jgi:hypothetical protein
MMWAEIVKTLIDYGVLGVVALFFFISYGKREDMFKKFMENTINFHQENMTELKSTIEQLSNSLITNNEMTRQVLSDIVIEVDDLKDKYNVVTRDLIETILDDKKLSKRVFYDLSKLLITRMTYKSIISFNNLLDNNGLINNEKLNIFKQNVHSDLKRYKDEIYQTIYELDFIKEQKEELLCELDYMYSQISNQICETIFEDLSLDNLKVDHNYFNTKQKFKNIFYDAQSEMLAKLKGILR